MVCCLCGDPSTSIAAADLDAVARACSPRVAPRGAQAVIFDVDGLSRACGPPEVMAQEVARLAATEGLAVRIAITGTMTAAWVLAHARAGTTVVPAGGEAAALAPIPIGWLGTIVELDHASARRADAAHLIKVYRDHFATLARWGLRSCGELAKLPRADVHARLGGGGVRLHQAACGEDVVPLVPVDEARRFVDRMVLEWPIDGLEPLSFVLARQCDRLATALEHADRGAIAITTTLTLVDKTVHARVLELPAPLRDARVWRTLVLLDLESHPPTAAIDAVELSLEVAPGHILQGSLFAYVGPSQEDLSTLMARLGALMGESRLGTPIVLDTYDAREVGMSPFRLRTGKSDGRRQTKAGDALSHAVGFTLRRLRLPLAIRVLVEHGAPVRLMGATAAMPTGRVIASAGPWRSSGGWWTADRAAWDRDEWDVQLDTGVICRLVRNRATGVWEIEGVFD